MDQQSLRRYWRIGTSDGKITYWDYMRSQNKVCIGWSTVGDLAKLNPKSKTELETILRDEGYYPGHNNTISAKATEIFNFLKNISIGDVILAQKGVKILGIGVVAGDYEYIPSHMFSHQKRLNGKLKSLLLKIRIKDYEQL